MADVANGSDQHLPGRMLQTAAPAVLLLHLRVLDCPSVVLLLHRLQRYAGVWLWQRRATVAAALLWWPWAAQQRCRHTNSCWQRT